MRYLIFLLLFISCFNPSPEVSDPRSTTTIEILESADTVVISLINDKLYILENDLVTHEYNITSEGQDKNLVVVILVGLILSFLIGVASGLSSN